MGFLLVVSSRLPLTVAALTNFREASRDTA
jgi:hypothetical protein